MAQTYQFIDGVDIEILFNSFNVLAESILFLLSLLEL